MAGWRCPRCAAIPGPTSTTLTKKECSAGVGGVYRGIEGVYCSALARHSCYLSKRCLRGTIAGIFDIYDPFFRIRTRMKFWAV